ncbi:tRNA-dihydrouridine(16/17) synthase [NAD(P)(+)]-like protein [Entomortierella beljakovae]|nr:tRNA-dihydrouridine(16/17) synthase [NAD(P)(+)]-like protein [Entomortierella beljakovae]
MSLFSLSRNRVSNSFSFSHSFVLRPPSYLALPLSTLHSPPPPTPSPSQPLPSPPALPTSYQSSSPYYTTLPPQGQFRQKIYKKYPHLLHHAPPTPNKGKEDAERRNAALAAEFKSTHSFPPKLSDWEFYRSIGSPKYIVAPMVDQSELPWRILSRRYNAELCYTPMFHAKLFVTDENYRDEQWPGLKNGLGGGGPNDRPLIAQFSANDPELLLQASIMVAPYCDAIDVNLGCPQNIAKSGHYGSYLMEDWPLISSLVSTLHRHLPIPVTAKIRIFPEVEKTIEYAKMIIDSGAQLLVVHGRLRENKGHKAGFADLEHIRKVQEAVGHLVPVIANGNIAYHEDLAKCMEKTGCPGVMTAEGNLFNPAIFTNRTIESWKLAEEYLDICEQLGGNQKHGFIRGHLFKLFRPSMRFHEDLRAELGMVESIKEMHIITQKIKERLIRDAEASRLAGESFEGRVDKNGFPIIPHWFVQPYLRDSLSSKNVSGASRTIDSANGDKSIELESVKDVTLVGARQSTLNEEKPMWQLPKLRSIKLYSSNV